MKTWMILLILVTLPAVVQASGNGHHHAGDEHLRGMLAVKENIPEELRIMDRTPVTPTAASQERGAALYRSLCGVCHGATGRGDGPAAAGMTTGPANFRDAEHAAIYSPGEKYWIIGNGLESGMPGFASQLSPLQRWDLVNYVQQFAREDSNDLFN